MRLTWDRRIRAGGKDLFVIGHFPVVIFHFSRAGFLNPHLRPNFTTQMKNEKWKMTNGGFNLEVQL